MNRIAIILVLLFMASATRAASTDLLVAAYLKATDPQPALTRLAGAPGVLEALLKALPANNGRERTRVMVALCMVMNAEQLAAQVRAIAEQDARDTRLFAAALEARLHRQSGPAPKDLAAVVEQLGAHADWHLRLHAARLVRFLRPARILAVQQTLLKDAAWPVRCRALESLGTVPAAEALPILEPILRDPQAFHVSERLSAARALGRLQHVPGLLLGLADPDRDVCLEVLASLDHCPNLPEQAMLVLKETLATSRDDMVKGIIEEILEKYK